MTRLAFRLGVAASVALSLAGCGGVPPELLGTWKGTSTLTVQGNGTALDSQALVTESGGKLSIVASGTMAGRTGEPVITCRVQGNVTSTGFEILDGSCALEGAPVTCNGASQSMTASITQLTAVRSDRQLNVNTSGKLTHPCGGSSGPSYVDFSLVSTLDKQ